MEVNSVFYESSTIGHHFRSKKSLALAYLMTIGSKALVLMEVNADSEPNDQHFSVQKSFDDEAAIKRQMVHEEQLTQFQRNLSEKPGVMVLKRGRNGELRHIHIRVKEDHKKGTRMVVWQSRLGGKKCFLLDKSITVKILPPSNPSSSSYSSSLSPAATAATSASSSTSKESFLGNIPILLLSNHSRELDIQFMTIVEVNVCLYLLQSFGIKDASIEEAIHYCEGIGY